MVSERAAVSTGVEGLQHLPLAGWRGVEDGRPSIGTAAIRDAVDGVRPRTRRGRIGHAGCSPRRPRLPRRGGLLTDDDDLRLVLALLLQGSTVLAVEGPCQMCRRPAHCYGAGVTLLCGPCRLKKDQWWVETYMAR